MHIVNEDRPATAPMDYRPLRYEQHTAECAEPEYDDPSLDGSLEMLGRVLIGAALVIVSIVTVLLVAL